MVQRYIFHSIPNTLHYSSEIHPYVGEFLYLCTPENFKLREDEENKCSCDGENKYPIDEKNKYPIDEKNKYPIDEENDLSTDEENNLPCYPVGIAFACFLQIEKEYGG